MPWFRFTGDLKVTIPFRNGACDLTFANLGEEPSWAWVARKVDKPAHEIVLHRAPNVMGLRVALANQGFEVPAGGPAEKVMRAAVKCGYAEELPDDEHWRGELLKARAALERAKSGPKRRASPCFGSGECKTTKSPIPKARPTQADM
jgi:hypothetical protein